MCKDRKIKRKSFKKETNLRMILWMKTRRGDLAMHIKQPQELAVLLLLQQMPSWFRLIRWIIHTEPSGWMVHSPRRHQDFLRWPTNRQLPFTSNTESNNISGADGVSQHRLEVNGITISEWAPGWLLKIKSRLQAVILDSKLMGKLEMSGSKIWSQMNGSGSQLLIKLSLMAILTMCFSYSTQFKMIRRSFCRAWS